MSNLQMESDEARSGKQDGQLRALRRTESLNDVTHTPRRRRRLALRPPTSLDSPMKRAGLVAYSDSDSDAVDDSPAPPNKKHKLPPLPSHLVVPVPTDDPSKHQGRTRTTPHVDGQWAAYVYVPVAIAALDHRPLRALVRRLLARAKEAVPSLQPLAAGERQQPIAGRAVEGDLELHISLSRPIFIRSHQREDVKRAVKSLASAHRP